MTGLDYWHIGFVDQLINILYQLNYQTCKSS